MGRLIERMFFPSVMLSFFALLFMGVSSHMEHKIIIKGAGATFPAPLYARWIASYEREHPHVDVNYHAIGSGGGIREITERKVQFGASDALLNKAEKQALPAEILQIPVALGPVVMAYNLPGVRQSLILTGDVISDIYLHKIVRWSNPRLQALNPGANLPDIAIRVTHRKDSSGTTYIFTDYLSHVSRNWKKMVGHGKKVHWPISHGAGEGNDGVAQQILLQAGGIGYLEFKYAENAGLQYAAVVNRDGNPVLPSVASVQAAERNTPPKSDSMLKDSIVNAPGKQSYPIAGFTYLLVYKNLSYLDSPETASELAGFLTWVLSRGQKTATQLQYTPLPEELRQKSLDLVHAMRMPGPDKCHTNDR